MNSVTTLSNAAVAGYVAPLGRGAAGAGTATVLAVAAATSRPVKARIGQECDKNAQR